MHLDITMTNLTDVKAFLETTTLTSAINASSFSFSSVKKNNSVISSSVMFSVGVISNLLALLVLKRTDSEHKRKLFYRLVAGLTLTDLFGTVALSPVVISVYVNNFKWIGGNPLCMYFAYMMVFAGSATMTIVCLMSIERLVCIYQPYVYFTRLRKRHATYFLLGAWLFAAIVASLPLLGFGTYIRQYPGTWCFFDYYTYDTVDRGFNYLFAILALSTISVTVTCNIIVLFTLFKSKMRGSAIRRSGDSRTFSGDNRRYAECQMAVQLIGVTIVFSSCYLPLMMRLLINQTKVFPVNRNVDLLVIRFASLNQILDPWVYILLRREVVWKVVSTVKSIFGINQPELPETRVEIQRQSSSVSLLYEQQERQSCFSFCWHCMCDPPAPRGRSMSVHSDAGRRSIMYSPTLKHSPAALSLAVGSAQNSIMLSGSLSRQQNDTNGNIRKLQKQVSFESNCSGDDVKIVTSQPPRYVRLSMLSDGSEDNNTAELLGCDTLVERHESDGEEDSV